MRTFCVASTCGRLAALCACFAAIVTMDAHGNSLHADVEQATGTVLETLRSA